jgi:hypothetical protein
MDWVELLRHQQLDFVDRFKQGHLLSCEVKGFNSELTVISDQAILDKIYKFSLEMALKYKEKDEKPFTTDNQQRIILNNIIGKLGEECLKLRLNDKITEVDYEIKVNGDGKSDFKLKFNSSIGGIQVKTRNSSNDNVRWSINKDEIHKNTILVCLLIKDDLEFSEIIQKRFNKINYQYNVISAGFLTKDLILQDNQTEFGINELLYIGGLKAYIDILFGIELKKLAAEYGIS